MPKPRGVELSRRAERALLALDARLQERVKEAIREVSGNPLSGKKLKGESAGLRSYRLGPLRIVYRFTRELVEVVFVEHRKDVYR
jgi:mRNA-degrading endonuclease RelE of RelBE toxin-antitoxin system